MVGSGEWLVYAFSGTSEMKRRKSILEPHGRGSPAISRTTPTPTNTALLLTKAYVRKPSFLQMQCTRLCYWVPCRTVNTGLPVTRNRLCELSKLASQSPQAAPCTRIGSRRALGEFWILRFFSIYLLRPGLLGAALDTLRAQAKPSHHA